jgi:hypothetical protein
MRTFNNTCIPSETLAAYKSSLYEATIEEHRYSLQVDEEPIPEMISKLTTCSLSGLCFITACNPYSAILTEEENNRRMQMLKRDLDNMSAVYFEAVGKAPDESWSESSFLVGGISLSDARTLGERYEQNAFLWLEAGDGYIPRLLLLR